MSGNMIIRFLLEHNKMSGSAQNGRKELQYYRYIINQCDLLRPMSLEILWLFLTG